MLSGECFAQTEIPIVPNDLNCGFIIAYLNDPFLFPLYDRTQFMTACVALYGVSQSSACQALYAGPVNEQRTAIILYDVQRQSLMRGCAN